MDIITLVYGYTTISIYLTCNNVLKNVVKEWTLIVSYKQYKYMCMCICVCIYNIIFGRIIIVNIHIIKMINIINIIFCTVINIDYYCYYDYQ